MKDNMLGPDLMTDIVAGAPLAALHDSFLLSLEERQLSAAYLDIQRRTGR
jgi:hypothetical protein